MKQDLQPRSCAVVSSPEADLHGETRRAAEGEGGLTELMQGMHARSEPFFPIRGWESQLEDFWCRWMGGPLDWFRNKRYLSYLRDAFSRGPQYRINTFMLMGRGDQGELHTFVTYDGWDRLTAFQTEETRERATEQAAVLNSLAREARQVGIDLYLWDHELQLPRDFAKRYPEARGEGTTICPSSQLVWLLLKDKYAEFFKKVPELAGIVLVFAETQFNILGGSPCGCDQCRGRSGDDFVRQIILTAREACQRHQKRLIVRNFRHGWEQIETIFAALRSINPPDSFTVMSKMVPWDFSGLQLPCDPSTTELPGRPRILEDTVGGEFRGKTHTVCLPADYYARHLRHAAEHGGSGAVFRLDHSAYPRSVFETPNEFNVWLTSQLLWDPDQDLEDLWQQWVTRRYGKASAPHVVGALRRSADIWEHSTNSFGFYCTSAHGHIAPFFRGPYNALNNLTDTGPILTRSSQESERKLEELLNPNTQTLNEVIAERSQAVQWAEESIHSLEKARPHLTAEAYDELSDYLRVQVEAARLFLELGDLFFTGLAILRAEGLPVDLLERLRGATERALLRGRGIENQFGRGAWPVAPDADGRGTRLERAVAGLWGEFIDRLLDKDRTPVGSWSDEAEASDIERLYLALLETAAGLGEHDVSLGESGNAAGLRFEDRLLQVTTRCGAEQARRLELALPVGTQVSGPDLEIDFSGVLRVRLEGECVRVEVVTDA